MNKILLVGIILGLILVSGIYVYNLNQKIDCKNQQIPDLNNIEYGNTEKVFYDACYFKETVKLRRIK